MTATTLTEIESYAIERLLESDVFRTAHRSELAKIVPHIQEIQLSNGEILFRQGEEAHDFYFLVDGKIQLKNKQKSISQVSEGFLGEEAIFEGNSYKTTAICTGNCTVLKVTTDHIREILNQNQCISQKLYQSFANHFSPSELTINTPEKDQFLSTLNWKTSLLWILSTAVPFIVYHYAGHANFTWEVQNFLFVFSAASMLWIALLVPDYVPALLSVLGIIILGVVPTHVALSGYTSGSFFLAVSVLALGSVIRESGIFFRLALFALKKTPKNQFLYKIVMGFIGILLTPSLPTANGRVALITPLIYDMIDSLGYRKGKLASAGLATAAFVGVYQFSSVFLSGKSFNFLILGLLPNQVQHQFTWGYWLLACSIAGLVMLIGFALMNVFLFKNKEPILSSKEAINLQLKTLGKFSQLEWIALMGLGIFIVSMLAYTLHKISPPWIGLSILYVLISWGFVSKTSFRQNIDWPFVFYLGGVLGLVETFNAVGLDRWSIENLKWLEHFVQGDIYILILVIFSLIVAVRIFLGGSTCVVLLSAVLLPVAQSHGLNPWIVAFTLLMASDVFFMEHQSTYYALFRELQLDSPFYPKGAWRKAVMWSGAFRLFALIASVPFWRYLGIL